LGRFSKRTGGRSGNQDIPGVQHLLAETKVAVDTHFSGAWKISKKREEKNRRDYQRVECEAKGGSYSMDEFDRKSPGFGG